MIEASVARLDASPASLRRRWSAAAKERIVAEAIEPGANVSAIARAHGLAPQQIFAWRRQAVRRAELGSGDAQEGAFAAVEVDGTAADGVVEISVAGAVLRIGPKVPASRVKELLQIVRSA